MRIIAFLLLITCFSCSKVSAQYELLKDDSLLNLLKNKYTLISKDRIDISNELITRYLPNQPIFDSLKNIIINEAETSRNRLLMCDAYNKLAQVYLNFYQRNQYAKKAKDYIDNCISIADESGLDMYKVSSFIKYAVYSPLKENCR